MTDNTGSGGQFKVLLVGGIVGLVALVFIAISINGSPESERSEETPPGTAEAVEAGAVAPEPLAEAPPDAGAAAEEAPEGGEKAAVDEERPTGGSRVKLGKAGGPETPYTPIDTMSERVAKFGKWNPPRPLRFVARS